MSGSTKGQLHDPVARLFNAVLDLRTPEGTFHLTSQSQPLPYILWNEVKRYPFNKHLLFVSHTLTLKNFVFFIFLVLSILALRPFWYRVVTEAHTHHKLMPPFTLRLSLNWPVRRFILYTKINTNKNRPKNYTYTVTSIIFVSIQWCFDELNLKKRIISQLIKLISFFP